MTSRSRWKIILRISSTFIICLLVLLLVSHMSSDVSRKSENVEKKVQAIGNGNGNVVPVRPWFFTGGLIRPKEFDRELKLWPDESSGDRIVNQLMFVPKNESLPVKKIYAPKLQELRFEDGVNIFEESNCPVKNCELVSNQSIADAIVFENYVTKTRENSSAHQVWIFHSLESPHYSGEVVQQNSVNWTATYRLDSDIVTPYAKWVYYDENVKTGALTKNYAEGKSKKVAWFVSNCHSKNKRLEYVEVLKEYIPVDVYGVCGDKVCRKRYKKYCSGLISKEYKFYLSFENANCRNYISEKFYSYGLSLDVIPVVMGPPKKDYEKVAPYHSFIHVEDFTSPKHLADYLHFLDKNDDEYNSYFLWKGTGEFINTFFMCRICSMLHAARPPHFYRKIKQWWRRPGICTKTFWNRTNKDEILNSLRRFKVKKSNKKLATIFH